VIEPFNSTHYQSVNASGWVYQSTNASQIVHFAWGNLSTTGGIIHFKNAVYQNMAIYETLTDNTTIQLEGEGIGTIFNSSAYKILDLSNNAWTNGEHMYCLGIRDITFTHYTQDNASATLDLWYSDVQVEDLWIINKNATRQGTGILTGPNQNNGRGFNWKSIEVTDYAVAYHTELDHLSTQQCHAIRAANIGFFFKLCSNGVWTAPFVYGVTINDTVHPFWCETTGWGMEINGPSLEVGNNLNISNSMFTFNGTSWFPIIIKNADADHSVSLTNTTSTSKFHFQGNTLAFPLHASGYNTTAENGGIQAHGLCLPPNFVGVTSCNTTMTSVGAQSFNSYGFTYICHNDTNTNVSGQTVYWYATAES
jgi:hypothetical protein